MGQCVSLKAGVVVAASEHHGSPSYRIMDKPSKNHNDSKGASKKGAPLTRGTATSFGFRRRPTSGIPMPVTAGSYGNDVTGTMHQRSKSAGPPEQERRRDEDNCHQRFHSSSSGRSTPRLAPPKKEAVTSGNALRTNRFGFRQPQQRYTNKVGDICNSHTASHYNQDKVHSLQQQHHQQQQQHQQIQQMHQMQHQQQREIQQDNYIIGRQSSRSSQAHPTVPSSKLRPSPVNNPPAYGGHSSPMTIETDRRGSGIPEPISKYTLHTSHLPLPQYAIRMNEANPKVAKTAANQSRQVSTASKCPTSSKESSGTEDSGVGSQQGYPVDHETVRGLDYFDSSAAAAAMVRRSHGRPRNLRMVLSGKSFDVRDVEDDSTVTEISVIPLPKSFATSANLNSGFVRDRTVQYQRILNKDNRYTDSTTSMSTTSSEGYGEGLGEEKVYKDRSHTEKTSSIKSDFSPPSSDDPEYGHGEAMADEYSLSSSDECRANPNQHLKTITNAAKSGSLPKNTLRSVLLTIEDPAFAAAAATTTSLIDDETSPADSLVDSLTASITQSDGKNSRKECIMDRSGNTLEDDSPGTPTNASNSLSLSEGREFFDDEIADQPGLTFDETLRTGTADTHSGGRTGNVVTENSHTLVESAPKLNMPQGRIAENGSVRRIARAESVDTLSPCESITSDDFMLDYDCSEGHSDDETNRPLDYCTAFHDLDEATIRDVIRELSAPKGTSQNHSNSNLANNNISTGNNNNNNHNTATGKLIKRVKQLQIGEEATGGDYYQLTYPN